MVDNDLKIRRVQVLRNDNTQTNPIIENQPEVQETKQDFKKAPSNPKFYQVMFGINAKKSETSQPIIEETRSEDGKLQMQKEIDPKTGEWIKAKIYQEDGKTIKCTEERNQLTGEITVTYYEKDGTVAKVLKEMDSLLKPQPQPPIISCSRW